VITGMLADLIGPDSLIVIAVVVVVLLFGGTRLPKLARGLGSASHEFKKGMEEGDPDKDKGDPSISKGDDKTSGPVQSN
jgi:sec-independent protein translocase protein TatA